MNTWCPSLQQCKPMWQTLKYPGWICQGKTGNLSFLWCWSIMVLFLSTSRLQACWFYGQTCANAWYQLSDLSVKQYVSRFGSKDKTGVAGWLKSPLHNVMMFWQQCAVNLGTLQYIAAPWTKSVVHDSLGLAQGKPRNGSKPQNRWNLKSRRKQQKYEHETNMTIMNTTQTAKTRNHAGDAG